MCAGERDCKGEASVGCEPECVADSCAEDECTKGAGTTRWHCGLSDGSGGPGAAKFKDEPAGRGLPEGPAAASSDEPCRRSRGVCSDPPTAPAEDGGAGDGLPNASSGCGVVPATCTTTGCGGVGVTSWAGLPSASASASSPSDSRAMLRLEADVVRERPETFRFALLGPEIAGLTTRLGLAPGGLAARGCRLGLARPGMLGRPPCGPRTRRAPCLPGAEVPRSFSPADAELHRCCGGSLGSR